MNDNLLTSEEAAQLLGSKKEVDANESVVRFNFFSKSKIVFPLVSTDLPKQESFRLFIQKSKKKVAKITLHHIHDGTCQCLLRIDINGTHKNPDVVNGSVPQVFHKYAGKTITESHIHFYVEGYDSSWALPIRDTEFAKWATLSNIEDEIQGMLNKFCDQINLSTTVLYDQKLPL